MPLDPARVQAVFLEAVELENLADRAAFLDCECEVDEELRRRVEALLAAHDQPDGLLDQPFLVPGETVATVGKTSGDEEDKIELPESDSESVR